MFVRFFCTMKGVLMSIRLVRAMERAAGLFLVWAEDFFL